MPAMEPLPAELASPTAARASQRRRTWRGTLFACASTLAAAAVAAPHVAAGQGTYTFPLTGRGDYWHSFGHPFESSPEEPLMHWQTKASALLTQSTDGGRDVVRLTPAMQGRAGILYNTVHADTNDFNAYIDFEIKTSPTSREAADGFAFWLLRDVPDVGPSMGISNKFVGLGVVVDTFANSRSSRTPYVYAFVNDGTVGWDASTDGKQTQLTQGCHVEINKPTRMYVSLQGQELRVALSTAHGFGHRYDCFQASGVRLGFESNGLFAVSAETGHYFATHDVSAVQIHSGHHHPATVGYDEKTGGHEDHYDTLHHGHEGLYGEHGREIPHSERDSSSHGAPAHADYDHDDHHDDVHDDHHAVDSHAKLNAVLEHKVAELRTALTDMSTSTGAATADKATLIRLEALKNVIMELLDEATSQSSRFEGVSSALSRMARMSKELRSTSTFFENEMRQAEAAVESLHHTLDELRRTHREVLISLETSHEDVRSEQKKQNSVSSRLLRVLLFFFSQAFIGGLVWVIAKSTPDLSTSGSSRRKL